MRHIAVTAVLLLSAAAQDAKSESPQFLIGPRIGPGELRIDAGQRIGENTVQQTIREDTAGIGGNPAARGYQNYWELTALKRLNERVSLGVSHKDNSYEFGRGRVTVFTAMFDL